MTETGFYQSQYFLEPIKYQNYIKVTLCIV